MLHFYIMLRCFAVMFDILKNVVDTGFFISKIINIMLVLQTQRYNNWIRSKVFTNFSKYFS